MYTESTQAAGASSCSAMGAGTISKTRAGLKSQMSKMWNIGKQSIASVLIASLALLSCKKDDSGGGGGYLPVRVSAMGMNMYAFEYDAQNRLSKVEAANGYLYDISYPEGKYYVIKRISGSIQHISCEAVRNGDAVTETVWEMGQAITYNYTLSNERVVKMSIDGADGSVDYTYDNAGNLLKLSSGQTLSSMTYDNKKGMFSNVKSPALLLMALPVIFKFSNVNNILSSNGSFVEQSYTYTYNEDGYPVSVLITIEAGENNPMSANYKIEYK